jgi:hypothetical protein
MNKIKLIGIIAVIAIIGLSLIGCGEKGGTVVITNNTAVEIEAYAEAGDSAPSSPSWKTIDAAAGTKETFSIGKEGKVFWGWRPKDNLGGALYGRTGSLEITKKGEEKPVTATAAQLITAP